MRRGRNLMPLVTDHILYAHNYAVKLTLRRIEKVQFFSLFLASSA